MVKYFVNLILVLTPISALAAPVESSVKPNEGTWTIDRSAGTMINQNGQTLPFVDLQKEAEAQAENTADLTPLEKYATSLHFHGLNPEEVQKFVGQDVSGLVRLLNNPKHAGYWGNIVHLIGMVGDESAVDELIAYAEDQSNNDFYAVEAKAAAPHSLGVLAGRTGSERAVQYLVQGLEPSKWAQRKDFSGPDLEIYQLEAVRYSLKGLAAAGTPSAVRALQGYQQLLKAEPELRSTLKRLDVDDAFMSKSLKTAKTVQSMGYYRAQSHLAAEAAQGQLK